MVTSGRASRQRKMTGIAEIPSPAIQTNNLPSISKGPRFHPFDVANAIDHTVKNTIQMGHNFISVKKIASVSTKINKIAEKKVSVGST